MKKFFSNSLLKRIVAFQVIIGMVPLLFFGISSIIKMSNVMKDEAIAFQAENIKQGTLYIELIMDDVESLIANISGIEEVNNTLSSSVSESSYDKLAAQAKMGYILSGYYNLKGLISIDIFSESGVHYHVGETLSITNTNTNVLLSLFDEARASEGSITWHGIEDNINLDSEYPHVITATKLLTSKNSDGSSKESKGLLVISYDPEILADMFGQDKDSSAFTVVLDKSNHIVFHPNVQYIGQVMSDDVAANISAEESGHFNKWIDQTNMLVVFDSTQKGGWSVARFVPLKDILSAPNEITVLFIILLVLSVTVIGVFGLIMSEQIIRPIKQVTGTFQQLQSGDVQNVRKLKIMHQDEIGELGKLFNSFIEAREDITTQKKLERKLSEQNQELQDALSTLKTAQAQIVQQEKMAGIGQLAAGVAHEINNPLGFVTSNFSTLNEYLARLDNLLKAVEHVRLGSDSCDANKALLNKAWVESSIDSTVTDLRDIFSDTQEGLKRISEIVNALNSFSRNNSIEDREPYDINKGVRTSLLIAANEIKYSSTVNFNPSAVPEIYANGGQINQVLLNIIVNAAQAIKHKQQKEAGLISIDTYVQDDYVCCDIGDNGCGMSEDVLNRIFEPFFTTKAVGEGTGLGLSLAYDIIVNKHQGRLEVSSALGEGTRFRIMLPIKQAKDEH